MKNIAQSIKRYARRTLVLLALLLRQCLRVLLFTGLQLTTAAALILALTLWLIQQPQGREWLLTSAVNILNQEVPNLHIALGTIETPEASTLRLSSLHIELDQKPLLALESLNLQVQWHKLLERRLQVTDIHVARLDLYASESSNDPALPLPELLQRLDIRPWCIGIAALNADEIVWHPNSDTQRPIALALQGHVAFWDQGQPFQGQLNLHTRPSPDSPEASLSLVSQWQEQQLLLTLKAREAAGGWFGRQLGLPSAQPLQLDGRVSLLHQEHRYQLTVQELQLAWPQRPWSLQGQLRADESLQQLDIDELEIQLGGHRQRLHGQWSPTAADMQLELKSLPLALLRPWLPAIERGELSGQLRLTGSLQDPIISGRASVDTHLQEGDSRWHVQLDAEGRYQQMQLALKPSNVSLQWQVPEHSYDSNATVEGSIDFADLALNLKGRAGKVDNQLVVALLERFGVPAPDALKPLDAQAQLDEFFIRGPLNQSWRNTQMRWKGTVHGHYHTAPLDLALDITGTWHRFQARATRLVFGQDTAEGPGSAELDGQIDLFGDQNQLQLQVQHLSVAALQQAGLMPANSLWSGSASGALQLQGRLKQPGGSLTTQARLLHPALTQPLSLNAQLLAKNGLVSIQQALIELREQGQTARFELSGNVDSRTPVPAVNAQLQILKLPSQLLALWGWPDAQGELQGGLNLQLPGTTKADAKWLAKAHLSGSLDYISTPFLLKANSEKPINTKVLWVGELDDSRQQLRFTSTMTLDGVAEQTPGKMNVTLDKAALAAYLLQEKAFPAIHTDIALNLQTLTFLLPDGSSLGGELTAAMTATGRDGKLDLRGDLQLQNGLFAHSDLGITIKPLTLTAQALGDHLSITQLSARDGLNGTLEGSGRVNWQSLESDDFIDLTLHGRDLGLLQREDVQGYLSGALNLHGSAKQMLLSGDLSVSPITVSIGGDLPGSNIPSMDVSYYQGVSNGPVNSDFDPLINFDLNLRADKQAYLRGRGLEAELAGKIHLGGNQRQPEISGDLHLLRGHFDLLGQRFKLTEANAMLSDQSLTVFASGTLHKTNLDITATLSGTGQDLNFELMSDPPMPEDEILARMLFGKSLENISASQALQLANGVSTLRGGGFDPIGKARDMLSLDTLTIGNTETDTGDSATNIGAGKYLGEKVYLELERTTDPAEPWRTNLTIELTPRLNLRGSVNTGRASEGLEVEWHKDY